MTLVRGGLTAVLSPSRLAARPRGRGHQRVHTHTHTYAYLYFFYIGSLRKDKAQGRISARWCFLVSCADFDTSPRQSSGTRQLK